MGAAVAVAMEANRFGNVLNELFSSRRGIRASLGKLKQEEEGRQRCRFDSHVFLTPSVSEGNRRLEVGWIKRMEDVRVCLCVECPKCLCFTITFVSSLPLFYRHKFASFPRATKGSTGLSPDLFTCGQRAVFSGITTS